MGQDRSYRYNTHSGPAASECIAFTSRQHPLRARARSLGTQRRPRLLHPGPTTPGPTTLSGGVRH